MIIHKNGFNYCTAEQMTIRLTDTAELDAAAKFAIERLYNVPLDAWTFVVMNRETLCVNKAHPKAERLLELATRFMEINPEHVESDLIYNEVKKIAGDSAIDALCRIWLSWRKERLSYLNHVRAVDFVERTREKKRDALENDGAFPDVDNDLLHAIRVVSDSAEEANEMVYLYGLGGAVMDTRKELADMIGSMSEEQFTQFFIKAIQDPETRAAVVGILESAGLLGGGG